MILDGNEAQKIVLDGSSSTKEFIQSVKDYGESYTLASWKKFFKQVILNGNTHIDADNADNMDGIHVTQDVYNTITFWGRNVKVLVEGDDVQPNSSKRPLEEVIEEHDTHTHTVDSESELENTLLKRHRTQALNQEVRKISYFVIIHYYSSSIVTNVIYYI